MLHQLVGHGSAIERDKGFAGTGAEIVNRPRQVPTLPEQIAYYTINCKKGK